MTPVDLIRTALKASGVIGIGQTADAEDTNDALIIANTILTEWQINRWLTWDLVEAVFVSTGAATYTVGSTGNFVFTGQRPDKIDAAFARLISTGLDTPLWPFQSQEGYDRIAIKGNSDAPESFWYDQSFPLGKISFYPVPSNLYELHVQAKVSLGQLTNLTTPIALPQAHVTALLWALAENLRPLYQLAPDPVISQRAQASVLALMNSIAQVPQAVSPQPSRRAGVFSASALFLPAGSQTNDAQ